MYLRKALVKERVECRAVGNLHAQNLVGHFTREPVEAGHQQHDQADDDGRDRRQQIELGADRHADCHREEDEAHVTRFLDRVTEADDG